LQRPSERRDDARRHCGVETERIADGDRDLATLEFRAVAEPRCRQRYVGLVPEQREIGVGIVAEQALRPCLRTSMRTTLGPTRSTTPVTTRE
jgi:hypothetical protein